MPAITRKSAQPFLWLLLVFGTIGPLLFLLFSKRKKGTEAIKSQVSKTEYAELIPYLVAQAKHETANFTSNVYKTNNNMFGMNVPSRRPFEGTAGTKTPEGGNYAKYVDDEQSARDMVLWLRFTKFPSWVANTSVFVDELVKRNYFTDDRENYLKALQAWIQK